MLDQKNIKNNQFYSLSVKHLNGCLPDEFISSPVSYVSLMGKDRIHKEIKEIEGLSSLNRIIYRTNICDKEFGAVFIRFFVYHNKDLNPSSLSVKGLEKGYPVIIKWE